MIRLNGMSIPFSMFPNQEHYMKVEGLEVKKKNLVSLIYDNDQDLINLAILKSWLDNMGSQSKLFLPYAPHSRMDRPNGYYAVSLEAVCGLINSMGFRSVVVREPHSPILLTLLDRVTVEDWCQAHIREALKLSGATSIYYPDYGALERYYVSEDLHFSWGKKNREFLTGKIESLEFHGTTTDNVLIVDDICSKGGTFIGGAKLLREHGAKKVSLLVAYCEDTVFSGDIFQHVNTIYTCQDWKLRNDPRFVKLP